jgi:hypothetical protein
MACSACAKQLVPERGCDASWTAVGDRLLSRGGSMEEKRPFWLDMDGGDTIQFFDQVYR